MAAAKNLNDFVKNHRQKRRIGTIGILSLVVIGGAVLLFIFRSSIFDLRSYRSEIYSLADNQIKIVVEAGCDDVWISSGNYGEKEISISCYDENDDYQIYWEGNELTIRNNRKKLPLFVDSAKSYIYINLSDDIFAEALTISSNKHIDLDDLQLGSVDLNIPDNELCDDRSLYLSNCSAATVMANVSSDIFVNKCAFGEFMLNSEYSDYGNLHISDSNFGKINIVTDLGAYISNSYLGEATIDIVGGDDYNLIDTVTFDKLFVNCTGDLAIYLVGNKEDYSDIMEIVCPYVDVEYLVQETYE